jgi:hypothetical protein
VTTGDGVRRRLLGVYETQSPRCRRAEESTVTATSHCDGTTTVVSTRGVQATIKKSGGGDQTTLGQCRRCGSPAMLTWQVCGKTREGSLNAA